MGGPGRDWSAGWPALHRVDGSSRKKPHFRKLVREEPVAIGSYWISVWYLLPGPQYSWYSGVGHVTTQETHTETGLVGHHHSSHDTTGWTRLRCHSQPGRRVLSGGSPLRSGRKSPWDTSRQRDGSRPAQERRENLYFGTATNYEDASSLRNWPNEIRETPTTVEIPRKVPVRMIQSLPVSGRGNILRPQRGKASFVQIHTQLRGGVPHPWACPVAAAASRYLGVLFSSPPRNHTPGCFRTPPSSGGTD